MGGHQLREVAGQPTHGYGMHTAACIYIEVDNSSCLHLAPHGRMFQIDDTTYRVRKSLFGLVVTQVTMQSHSNIDEYQPIQQHRSTIHVMYMCYKVRDIFSRTLLRACDFL